MITEIFPTQNFNFLIKYYLIISKEVRNLEKALGEGGPWLVIDIFVV